MIKTIEWTNEGVRMIDQRLLPAEEKYLMLRSYEEVAEAIKKMVVRGAPAGPNPAHAHLADGNRGEERQERALLLEGKEVRQVPQARRELAFSLARHRQQKLASLRRECEAFAASGGRSWKSTLHLRREAAAGVAAG